MCVTRVSAPTLHRKMLGSSKNWLPILLVLGLSRDCQGWKPSIMSISPIMWPANEELYIDEGDSLELTCMSTKTMRFYYPKDVADAIETSPASLKEQSLSDDQKIIFRRSQTVYGDTGWYGCANHDTNVTSGIYDQSTVSWMYVYVRSNRSYFVESKVFQPVRKSIGESAILPCRPTSPRYKVILNVNDKEIWIGGKVSYDPRFGFTVRNIALEDSDFYQCVIQNGITSQEIDFLLIVMLTTAMPAVTTEPPVVTTGPLVIVFGEGCAVISRFKTRKTTRRANSMLALDTLPCGGITSENPVLNEPEIVIDTLRPVKRGQILYVNCSTVVDVNVPSFFFWITPQRGAVFAASGRITSRPYTEMIGANKQKITRELIINGVTDEDKGMCKCILKTNLVTKTTAIYIKVYDPHIKYINLMSLDSDRYYLKKYGDHVQWIVEIDAYPQPKLKWLNPRGNDIIGTWTEPARAKYAVSITSSYIILRINRLNLDDTGLYSLQATNEDGTETLNFTLKVIAKPIPMFEGLETFYLPKQKVEILCNIVALPGLNVSWTFLKVPNYPSLKGSELVKLKNYSMVPKTSLFHSVVTFTIEMSGHLTCTACNAFGCALATDVILVSDVPGGFGIMEKDKQPMAGDDVEITCAASIYNYTGVEWLINMDQVIADTDRIWMTKSSTNLTHRSTLRIKNVQKSDNGSHYVCRASKALYHDIEYRDSEYNLLIHDLMAPFISETNMNKTTIALDLRTDGHKSMVLKCHVRGMPKPTVTWFKDDTRISANEQYEYRYGNQELYIKYFHDENSGRYSCKVENRSGKDENYQIISIKGKEVAKVLIISIVVLLLICVISFIHFSITLHREKVTRKQLLEAGLTHFEEGAVQCLNPNLTVDDQAEFLPYDKKWEFPREKLKLGKELGSGAFGVVAKAHALGICKDEAISTVAVKMVRKSTDSLYIRALASELKIMVHVGKHLNVVNLLGACTKNIFKRELLVIVEYCHFGNLHDYLLRYRADFINHIDPATRKLDPSIGLHALTRTTSVESNSNQRAELVSYTAHTDSPGISISPDDCVLSNNSTEPGWRSTYSGNHKNKNVNPLCTQDLLSWAFQVARGMEYLSQRKVLHGDLAARNILLAENNIVKISDFGLARTMSNDHNYKKQGGVPLPIKWMAIESIRDRIFSTQSDIWSFGIVLWEFFTLAETPYPTMGPERQYQRLIEGYRMEQPEYATNEVYNIMLQCWEANPTLRPTFTYLASSIGTFLEECVKQYYVELNIPYMNTNTFVLQNGEIDYLTMMSAPDHDALVSPNNEYVNSPSLSPAIPHDDSYIPTSPSRHNGDLGIFSPRITSNYDKINFPTSNGKSKDHSDSESKAVELSPMLNHEDDNYQETNKRTPATTGIGLTETSRQILR